MRHSWPASTTRGTMVGDYISTSFSAGTAHPLFAAATAPSGSVFNEAMYSPASGLAAGRGRRHRHDRHRPRQRLLGPPGRDPYAQWLANGGTEGGEDSP